MTTAIRIWGALAVLSSKPGMWTLPVTAVFLYLLGVWALLEMAGSEDDKIHSHPEVLEEERKQALDAAFQSAHPKYTPAGPTGLRPGFTRDHHALVSKPHIH